MTLKERDKQYIWHPFDQMKGADIIPIVKGEGACVYDENGKRYIDAFSSWWTNAHGHCNKYIAQKISEQAHELEHVAFGGFTHPQAVRLAERLVHLLPNSIQKIFFSDNGSTANEVAMKMTMQYWFNKGEKRNTFIALDNDYHGDTFGSMCLTARGGFNEPFERFMFDVKFIPAPTEENRDEVKKLLGEILKTNDVAGFIFEPLVQGAGGMLMHSSNVLSELITLCKEHGVLTIADEVFTGFGRTGKYFACNHLAAHPDIVCLSKALTGGFMPLGITAVSQQVFDAFYSDDKRHTFLHGHSYTGNPIACAVANASLDLFEKDTTWQNIDAISKSLKLFVEEIKNLPKVRAARSFGCIAAIELEAEGQTSYFNDKGKECYNYLLEKGIIIRPLGNVMPIIPPYCVNEKDLTYIFEQIRSYID